MKLLAHHLPFQVPLSTIALTILLLPPLFLDGHLAADHTSVKGLEEVILSFDQQGSDVALSIIAKPVIIAGEITDLGVTNAITEAIARTKQQAIHQGIVANRIGSTDLILLKATKRQLSELIHKGNLFSVEIENFYAPNLSQSLPRVGANEMRSRGATGLGKVIAILDTGVDAEHNYLKGRSGCARSLFFFNVLPKRST